jgi:thiol-disulfide isomerase/thioredoxin
METVRPKMTLLKLLQGVVTDQDPPFTRAPGASPNPLDLIGKPAPAFDPQPALSAEIPPKQNDAKTPPTPRKNETPPPQAAKRFLKPHKLPRLLVFWSIRCPHCRTTIPPLDAYAQKHNQRLQVLSFVQSDSQLVKDMLKTFVKDKQIKLAILDDPKGQVSNDYYILKVPTLLLVDTQGIVRGVSTGGGEKVGEDVERLLKDIEKK